MSNDSAWFDGDVAVDMVGFPSRDQASETTVADLWRASHKGWDSNLSDQGVPKAKSVEEILRDDPDIVRELQEKDPTAYEAFLDTRTEEVARLFRAQNPKYVRSERNQAAVVAHLLKKHLGIDYLEGHEAITEAFNHGVWTVANLQHAYQELLSAGALDVPAGETRALNEQDMLKVVAALRLHGPDAALTEYIAAALGGRSRKGFESLMTEFPELAKRAVSFVFFHMRGMDKASFQAFQKAKINQMVLPTLASLDDAWTSFALERYEATEAAANRPQQPKAPTEADYSSMTDAEIETAVNNARKELALARRQSRTTGAFSTSK